jgi:hypothetical protein
MKEYGNVASNLLVVSAIVVIVGAFVGTIPILQQKANACVGDQCTIPAQHSVNDSRVNPPGIWSGGDGREASGSKQSSSPHSDTTDGK